MNQLGKQIKRRRLCLEHFEQRLVLSAATAHSEFGDVVSSELLASQREFTSVASLSNMVSEGGNITLSFNELAIGRTNTLGSLGATFDSDSFGSFERAADDIVGTNLPGNVGDFVIADSGQELVINAGLLPFPTENLGGEGGTIVITKPAELPGETPLIADQTEQESGESEIAKESRIARVGKPPLENVRVRASWFEVATAERQGLQSTAARNMGGESLLVNAQASKHSVLQHGNQSAGYTAQVNSNTVRATTGRSRIQLPELGSPTQVENEANAATLAATGTNHHQSYDPTEANQSELSRDAAFSAVFTELGSPGGMAREEGQPTNRDSQSLWITHDTSHVVGMALVALLSVDHLQRRQARPESDPGAEELPKRQKNR